VLSRPKEQAIVEEMSVTRAITAKRACNHRRKVRDAISGDKWNPTDGYSSLYIPNNVKKPQAKTFA